MLKDNQVLKKGGVYTVSLVSHTTTENLAWSRDRANNHVPIPYFASFIYMEETCSELDDLPCFMNSDAYTHGHTIIIHVLCSIKPFNGSFANNSIHMLDIWTLVGPTHLQREAMPFLHKN